MTFRIACSTVSLPYSLKMDNSAFLRASVNFISRGISVLSTVALYHCRKRSKPSFASVFCCAVFCALSCGLFCAPKVIKCSDLETFCCAVFCALFCAVFCAAPSLPMAVRTSFRVSPVCRDISRSDTFASPLRQPCAARNKMMRARLPFCHAAGASIERGNFISSSMIRLQWRGFDSADSQQ